MPLVLECQGDDRTVLATEKLVPYLPYFENTTLEQFGNEPMVFPYKSTTFQTIIQWLEDDEQRIASDILRDVIEVAEFLDMIDLLKACISNVIDDIRADDTSGEDLRTKLFPLPGNSGILLLDQVIEQCDERAYTFLTDASDDHEALVDPENRQILRWISAQAKLGPWKEGGSDFFIVEKIGWFRDPCYCFTLVLPTKQRDLGEAGKTLYIWDLRRRSPILKVSQLYDAAIGPFDLIYTMGSDDMLTGWEPKTGTSRIDPPLQVSHCAAVFASHDYLYTDPGYNYLTDDDEYVYNNDEDYEKYRRARLWFKQETTNGSGLRSLSRIEIRGHDHMILRFSTDGSFAFRLEEDGVLLYTINRDSPKPRFRRRGFFTVFDSSRDFPELNNCEYRNKYDLIISPDDTFIALLWKNRVILRPTPSRQAREAGKELARDAWTEAIEQEYEVPVHIRHADDYMAGLAISPNSHHIAIMTIHGSLMLLQRTETSFDELFVSRRLRTLHMSDINKDVSLSWSPNGDFLAAAHDRGFQIIPIQEMIREHGRGPG